MMVLACHGQIPAQGRSKVGLMIRFLIARMSWFIPNFLVLTFLLFGVLNGWLGSPAAMMLGQDASPEAIAELNAHYGFNDPIIVQYGRWLLGAMKGDLGRSFASGQPVAGMLAGALPVTIELSFWAVSIAAVAAITLNTFILRNAIGSRIASMIDVICITVPNFMLGAILVFVFAIYLKWLPTSGWVPWSQSVSAHLTYLVLPVVTLTSFYFGSFGIIYRAEYQSVTGQLFVRVAKAKGLSDSGVSWRHILPNSIQPVVTFIGISLGQLAGGAVVTEVVFSVPGVGRMFVSAIAGHDYPVVLAIGMVVLTGMMLCNLLADLALAIINPQVRLSA
jgi:peptide/nickel transport system permease protein